MSLTIAFLIAALVLFVLATVGVPSPPRFQLLAAGLACYIISLLVGQFSR